MIGLPAAIATGNLRRGADLMLSTYADLSNLITGVELQVRGEEQLWSHRPAVFIFNHQSGLDSLLMARLLRRDIVGVAQEELRHAPIVGQLLQIAGTVFVDRSDRAKAVASLGAATLAAKQGLSIVMAPEGTRSATRKLGPFKKGAFHMAMAAGIPIVPVVIKNALDALPRHATVVRPATIEVVVHEPISTKGWKKEDLDDRISEIHALFESTLAET